MPSQEIVTPGLSWTGKGAYGLQVPRLASWKLLVGLRLCTVLDGAPRM